MKCAEHLAARKSAIVKQWFDRVVATYPTDTARFLKSQKDPFHNPVGKATIQGLTAAFDGLLADAAAPILSQALDPIIRIRAVQSFTPAQATAFVLDLKTITRDVLRKDLNNPEAFFDLFEWESRIDVLLMVGFDIYVRCRETLFQLKIDTEKNRIYSAFSRAGLIVESPEDTPVSGNS